MNSAPEKYQQIIRQVVSDIEGALNIADDLVVHGKSIEEHDQSLHKVLQRLDEKNLTLNPMKCEYRMDKVVFMGLLLPKYGIGPTEERCSRRLNLLQQLKYGVSEGWWALVHLSSPILQPLRSNLQAGRPLCMGQRATMATGKCTRISLF